MIDSAEAIAVLQDFRHSRMSVPAATLTQVQRDATLDATRFNLRDQELSWRDLAVASLMLEVSLEASTVWAFPVARPRIPGVVPASGGTLVGFVRNEDDQLGDATGAVVHVLNSSVPYDAIVTDQYLYNRDAVLHEVVVRASKVLKGIELTALFPGLAPSVAWSRAAGLASDAGVGINCPLDTRLFKDPDRNLAERDNQLAGYAARLIHALMNPFEVAARLWIEVAPDVRSAEVYSLLEDTADRRVWGAEPALSNRVRVTYDRRLKTLRWTDESPLSTHTPQPAPIAIDVSGSAVETIEFKAVDAGQSLVVIPRAPASPGVSQWAEKAQRVKFPGEVEEDGVEYESPVSIVSSLAAGAVQEYRDLVLATTGGVTVLQPALESALTLREGTNRITLLVQPDREFSVLGARNLSGRTVSGTGCLIPPGSASTQWRVPVPTGEWKLKLEYSSAASTSVAFSGAAVGTVQLDGTGTLSQTAAVSLQTFGGTLSMTSSAAFYVARLVVFTDGPTACDYALRLGVQGESSATSVFSGKDRRTDAVSFDFDLSAEAASPVLELEMTSQSGGVPLRVKRVHAQDTEAQVPTPGTAGFEYWKFEMVNRAARGVTHSYGSLISGSRPVELFPPPQDQFAGRREIVCVNGGVLMGSTSPFSKETGEPGHAGNAGGKSGWWKWTARSNGALRLDATGSTSAGVSSSGCSFDPLLAVYTGTAVDQLSAIGSSGNGALEVAVDAGVEYQLTVDGYNGASGAVAIRFQPSFPSNERPESPLEVVGFVRDLQFTTSAVGTGWISWTASFGGKVVVDALDSAFQAAVSVNGGAPSAGRLYFDAVAGEVYAIKVSGSGAAVVHIGPELEVGGKWTSDSTLYWLSLVSSKVPNFYSTFRRSRSGDVGKPALSPAGLEVNQDGTVTCHYSYEDLSAEVVALQPWMVELGLCVACREFWPAEAELTVDESS